MALNRLMSASVALLMMAGSARADSVTLDAETVATLKSVKVRIEAKCDVIVRRLEAQTALLKAGTGNAAAVRQSMAQVELCQEIYGYMALVGIAEVIGEAQKQ